MHHSGFRLTLLTGLLVCFSGCDQIKPKPHEKGNNRDLLAKYDKPIAFKKRTLGYISRPEELGKYVCQALENQLEDRYIVHQQYSATFILKTLSELPATLQNVYATCYLESELKEESFSDYFRINQAFLGPQALEGYKAFAAITQAKLLSQAMSLGTRKAKNDQEKAQIAAELGRLDKLWKQQSLKEVNKLRGLYSRARFDAGDWPARDKND